MAEKPTESTKRMAVGHKRNGRSCYDKEATRELIEACLRPDVSSARVALQHGITANLLRAWITRPRRHLKLMLGRPSAKMATAAVRSAFVLVVVATKVAAYFNCRALGRAVPQRDRIESAARSALWASSAAAYGSICSARNWVLTVCDNL